MHHEIGQDKHHGHLPKSRAGRFALTALAGADVALRAVALADLVNRPQKEVKGSKAGWAVALTVVNSVGILPLAYLILGRDAD